MGANVNEHKSLEEIGKDLDVFARYRKTNGFPSPAATR